MCFGSVGVLDFMTHFSSLRFRFHGLRTRFYRDATSDNIESIVTRGRGLWNAIYQPHADKLHDKLGSYHPDFICKSNHVSAFLTYSFQFWRSYSLPCRGADLLLFLPSKTYRMCSANNPSFALLRTPRLTFSSSSLQLSLSSATARSLPLYRDVRGFIQTQAAWRIPIREI